MSNESMILMVTAASIGFFHTVLGPDHYIPFIVMAKARRWSYLKTCFVTVLCGLGHVGSSVVLGLVGVAFGVALSRLEMFESVRGNWAGWAMIAFGLIYFCYGLRRAVQNKPHTHSHEHDEGGSHSHVHTHHEAHAHPHASKSHFEYTPWVLFVIFIFGPCEPLIPLLIYPAAKQHFMTVAVVSAVFGAATILTMLGIVLASTFGLNFIPVKRLERYSHALAGFAILACGIAVQLGL